MLAEIAAGRAQGRSQVSVGVGGRVASDPSAGGTAGEAQQLAAREALGEEEAELCLLYPYPCPYP